LVASRGTAAGRKRSNANLNRRNFADSLTFNATGDAIAVRIKDEGKGFDWRRYLELSPER
jgi:hypothetical protein